MQLGEIIRGLSDEARAAEALVGCGDIVLLARVDAMTTRFAESVGEYASGAVRRFARNEMCALVAPALDVTPATLVDRLLDPAVRLGTSTPKADPSGDYAWLVFERIEQQGRKGAFQQLAAKALQLTGGPNSPPPPTFPTGSRSSASIPASTRRPGAGLRRSPSGSAAAPSR